MQRDETTGKSAGFLREIFLARADATRCFGSLAKLSRHLNGPVVVTGGIAAGWHLLQNGGRIIRRPFNDIDIVVEGLASLRASLRQDFLIRHFHPYRAQGKILLMLVDEEHGTRIDVFTPSTSLLTRRLHACIIGELPLRLVSAEDLLAKLLAIVYAITESRPVEAKYFAQFHLLLTVADAAKVRAVWREYRQENQPLDFAEAAAAVQRSVAANAALLQTGQYSRDLNHVCSWCQASELFPLAPLTKIYEILGYV